MLLSAFCETEHTAQHNTVHSSVAGQWTQNISANHPGAESLQLAGGEAGICVIDTSGGL